MSLALPVHLPSRIDPLAPVRQVRSWLGNSEGRTSRRTNVTGDRAHIEVRGVDHPDRPGMADHLREALQHLDGVQWAEVDAVVGRAVVLFDPSEVELDDLVSAVEDVEDAHGAAQERFPHDRPDHPADLEPIHRQTFALAADVAGLGVATVGQALQLTRLPAEIPGVLALLDSQPRIRRFLENRLGRPTTDVVVASTSALANALGQGPIGLFVDIGHRSALIAEQQARRAAWTRREPELIEGPHSVRHEPLDLPPRTAALPKGPIERYTDGAAIASLAGVGVALGLTGQPRRAADLLLTGVPKAATLGREAFAAGVDVALSRRDVLVMDPAALRRLDRADQLLFDARLMCSGRWSVETVEALVDDDPAEPADHATLAARARSLLDPTDPSQRRRRGSWVLAPWPTSGPRPRGSVATARRLAHGGRKALGLWHGDHLVAVVAVAEEPVPLSRELVTAARDAGLEVVLVGGTDVLGERLGDVVRTPSGQAVEHIRAAQEEGRVVMFVSGRAHRGLRAADIGIGVQTPGGRAPLGAHLVVKEGLGQAWPILEAVKRAREVSARSALFALGGATAGGLWSIVGTPTTSARRTMLAVNASALVSQANGALAGVAVGAVIPPRPPAPTSWHELKAAEVVKLLDSREAGLSALDRSERLAADTSRVERLPIGLVRAALDELINPLTPLLAAGAALSAATGSLTDAGLVLGVVGVNSLVGAVQRTRTERAVLGLERDGLTSVQVLVGGDLQVVTADQIVVGDVVVLEAGDTVPGDCRLVQATALEVDESALTGESLPVAKSTDPSPGAPVAERHSMLYEGTVVAAGEATAVVVAVGRDTEAGRSAEGAGTPPPTGVERRLAHLTNLTLPATLAAGAAVTGLGFLYQRPARDAIGSGVSLMVAAVPEGLPALATLSQVASARRLAARNALVRNPRAIEALGRVDQVWFDKTGTLTQGSVTLARITDGDRCVDATAAPGGGADWATEVLAVARRATPPPNGNGSLPHATDRAVVEAAAVAGVDDADQDWTRIDDLPFESARAYHAVLGRLGRRRRVAVKGAPETVLPRCRAQCVDGREVPLDEVAVRRLEEHVDTLGRAGLRVLAVAEGAPEPGTRVLGPDDLPPLVLHGFIGLSDVIRPTAAASVATLTGAGIQVGMITGDHRSTAEAIAAELDLLDGRRVLTGQELDQLTDDELDEIIDEVAVFARVTPLQKVRIVASGQRRGRVVAMTGDGANDASAIRLADAGIALGGRGTDAARATADLVVGDDRVETIVDAVVEGRAMWESVRAAVAILVGGNLGEIGFTLAGTVFGGTAPLNPRQLLLVNLLTDMAPALAIALREPADRSPEALLHAGPDASLGGALTRDILVRAGATATGATLAWGVGRLSGTPTRARTIGLVGLVGTQLAQTVVAGGRSPLVLGATAVSVGALVVAVQTPGVSQFFGCRPLGPLGWATAGWAAGTATTASIVVPWAVEHPGRWIVERAGDRAGALRSLPLVPGRSS